MFCTTGVKLHVDVLLRVETWPLFDFLPSSSTNAICRFSKRYLTSISPICRGFLGRDGQLPSISEQCTMYKGEPNVTQQGRAQDVVL